MSYPNKKDFFRPKCVRDLNLRIVAEILVCRFGIPIQRLDDVLQPCVGRAVVEGFAAVVHRAVGDGSDYGFAVFDRDDIVLLQLACRNVTNTRDVSGFGFHGFNRHNFFRLSLDRLLYAGKGQTFLAAVEVK